MKNRIITIIGLIVGWILLAPVSVHAQDLPSADCLSTLYDGDFRCSSVQVRSYCDDLPAGSARVGAEITAQSETSGGTQISATVGGNVEVGSASTNSSVKSSLAFYKSAYCNLQQQDEDEIFQVVTDQMNAENPGFEVDDVKTLLTDLTLSKDKLGEKSLFDLYDQANILYENEKVIQKSKKALTQQFKSREMWANGSLSDSPFDLVVDLNLIEIVLFGSQAKWMDDVYTFPKKQENVIPGSSASQGGETPAGAGTETGAGAADQQATGGGGTTQTGPNQCGSNCGNGKIEEGEECDDGNTKPGDGCDNLCKQELVPGAAVCGDGKKELGEGCDDGNLVDGDGCNSKCKKESDFQGSAECGNGIVDAGEECDDGETKSGDGCSSDCMRELGSTLACMDPQAVTFKKFEPKPIVPQKQVAEVLSNESKAIPTNPPANRNPNSCAQDETSKKPIVQSSTYSATVPGTLKEFPASNKPPCGEGMTEYNVSFSTGSESSSGSSGAAGSVSLGQGTELGITVGESTFNVPRCIPTSACGSFEAARELLFGKDYKNDKEKSAVAAAIEAFVCIKVTKENRPESPYPVTEGCVDCHILAMGDIMNKLLEKNVAALENNTMAWGLSNRWGPGFSFNLNVTSQSGKAAALRAIEGKKSDDSPQEQANLEVQQMTQQASHQVDPLETLTDTAIDQSGQTSDAVMQQALRDETRKAEEVRLGLKFYRNTREASAVDQNSFAPISAMLSQMLDSFTKLQDLYVGIAAGLKFHEKEKCEF